MKVGTMSDNLALVGEGLSRSASALTVIIYLMVLFIVISAAIMHMLEWDPIECVKEAPNEFEDISPCTHGFHTIPNSVWFVMVTMTSVGYGDYSPGGGFGMGLCWAGASYNNFGDYSPCGGLGMALVGLGQQ